MAGARRSLSLPAGERLRRAGEFQAVFERGQRVERDAFVALWHRTGAATRVGFTVARKVRGAALRNRARRRLREAYRQQQGLLPHGVSVVFVGRDGVRAAPFGTLTRAMREVTEEIARRVGVEGVAQ